MSNWWDQAGQNFGQNLPGLQEGASSFLSGLGRGAARVGGGALRTAFPGLQLFGPLTSPITSALAPQQRPAAAPGAGAEDRAEMLRMQRAGQPRSAAPAAPQGFMGMSDEELMAWILSGGGGGGGVDLSGYNTMLGDLSSREGALGGRKAEQEAFLTALFEAAEGRSTADRDAVAAAVQSQLESDSARRAQEMALVRGDDASRRATADLARGALGVEPGEDLSSELAQNQVAGVGSSGSVADRDARLRQSIAEQQFGREISGLTPMREMSVRQLNREYEDRLAQLASERAAIQAQMAQTRASASGRGGSSVSERLAALNFMQGLGAEAPAEMPKLPSNATGIDVLSYYSNMNQANAGMYADVFNRMPQLLRGYALDPVTLKPRQPIEVANDIVDNNPGLESSYDFILAYLQTAG